MIHHFGTFDVANYGDLLFPLILEARLSRFGRSEFRHFSPLGGAPPVEGGVASLPSLSLEPAGSASTPVTQGTPTGVIVGGGHLIHASPTPLAAYREPAERALQAYPSLWLGAAHSALKHAAPLIWNAPGVPSPLGPEASEVLCWSLSFADYVSVRDERSLKLLRNAGFQGEAEVVPDTALELVRLFDAADLDAAYRRAFEERQQAPAQDAIAFHLNARYLGEEPGFIARRIDQICEAHHATPILLGLGACHGDDALVREVGAALRGAALLIDSPRSLIEAVACIARAKAYLGSSLHGAITACSFGIPAAIVASEREDGGKFSAFLGAYDLEAWLLPDWASAEAKVAELLAGDHTPWRAVSQRALPALDRHWERIEETLRQPLKHPEARGQAALRWNALTERALASAGLYAPLLNEQASLSLSRQDSIDRQKEHIRNLKAAYREANKELRRKISALEASQNDQPEN